MDGDRGRPVFDEAAFARAVNTGISPDGRVLHTLMPRFDLTPAEVETLVAFLRQRHTVAGVSQTGVTVATIVPAAPALRAYGLASARAVGEAIEANPERYFGRRVRHVVLDAAAPVVELERQLETDPPVLVIASVGLDPQGPVAELFNSRGMLNFAPVAAPPDTPAADLVIPLLPDLRRQAIALIGEAQAQHGCIDLAFAKDAISTAVAQSLASLVEMDPACPALLLLAPPSRVAQTLAGLGPRRLERIYASAEQIGPGVQALAGRCPLTVASASRDDLATTVARNAATSVRILNEALAKSGSRFSRRTLANNLRSAIPPQTPVFVQFDKAQRSRTGCCPGSSIARC
ncbi:MAG: hypothetical protein WA957_07680 [Alteraurantiacibacter sp.]